MVIKSYFLSRHLHRPCVIHDLSTICVPQLCLNMVIVVVNHVFKHVTRRNNTVITSTGTLNNNTPLSIRIINRFLSAWPCSPNAGISLSPLIFLFHLEFFQQSPKHHATNPLWSALIPNKQQKQKLHSFGNTLDFDRKLLSLPFKLTKASYKVYTNTVLRTNNPETIRSYFRKQRFSSEGKCDQTGRKLRNFRSP